MGVAVRHPKQQLDQNVRKALQDEREGRGAVEDDCTVAIKGVENIPKSWASFTDDRQEQGFSVDVRSHSGPAPGQR